MQLAKIEKLSVNEIKNSIDDEPNNNIVQITGVHNNSVKDMIDGDTVMIDEPSKDTKYKRSHRLTSFH